MKKLFALVVPLLGMACVSPVSVEYDELPTLSSPDSVVIGSWEKTSSSQINTSLACVVRMALKTRTPIVLDSGEVRLEYDPYGIFTPVNSRSISFQEIGSLWGGSQVSGIETASFKIHPPAFSYGNMENGQVVSWELYRGGYTATVMFLYHSGDFQGEVAHTWRCEPPGE
ncbi:MAG: hypothetical protein ABIF06_00480 [bacterium]